MIMDFSSKPSPLLGESRKIANPYPECSPLRADFEKLMPKRVQPVHHDNALVVSNLSEDTKDHDVLELFREFSPTRCFLFPSAPGKSAGTAFVHLQDNDQAEKSIQKFDGFVFKSQTIKVAWFFVKGTPRPWACGCGVGG